MQSDDPVTPPPPPDGDKPAGTPEERAFAQLRATARELPLTTTRPWTPAAMGSVASAVEQAITAAREAAAKAAAEAGALTLSAGVRAYEETLRWEFQGVASVLRDAVVSYQARERDGILAALAAGIDALPEVERSWVAEDAKRGEDLARRLSTAFTANVAELQGVSLAAAMRAHPKPAIPTDPEEARKAEEARIAAWGAEVDALAAQDSPDGRMVRAALARMWAEAAPGGRAVTYEEIYRLTATHEGVETDSLPRSFAESWHLPSSAEATARIAEVEALTLWPRVRGWWREENAPALATRQVLADQAEDPLAADPSAEAALRVAVEAQLRAAKAQAEETRYAVGWREAFPDSVEEGRSAVDGMHATEAAGVAFLAALGGPETLRELAKRTAAEYRAKAQARWAEWTSPQIPGTGRGTPPWGDRLRFPRILARVLWLGEIRDRLAREKDRPPALTHGVLTRIGGALRPGLVVVEENAQRLMFDRNGTAVAEIRRVDVIGIPTLNASALDALSTDAPALLASVDFQRALYWLVTTGHAGWLSGAQDFRTTHVEGGWAALPEVVGGGKREDLKRTILAMAHLCWTWPDGTKGNLLSYTERRAHPGQRAQLTVIRGDMLLPGYVHAITGTSPQARQDRPLVPLLPPGPFVGREREHGSQGAFQIRLLSDMRARATELVDHGGVRWTEEDLATHGAAVGLPDAVRRRVFSRWLRDGDDGAALFQRVGTDRYTLGPAHAAAREFMEAGGRSERAGARGGQLRAEFKRRAAGRRGARARKN